MKFIFSISIILLIINFQIFSQDRDVENLHHSKRHDVAKHLVEKGSYYNAIAYLESLAKEHPKNKKYLNKLAEAYFMSRDYKNAEIWYNKIVELDAKLITSALYKLAETQKYNAKYSEAKANFQLFFDSKYRDSRGEKYKAFSENEIQSCEFALQHLKDTVKTNITHLGDSINSAYSDFSPSMLNDSTLVFASLQSDSILTYEHEEVHFNHTKLYKSQINNNDWTSPVQIENINSIFENNANGCLSSDGKKFYFSRCFEDIKHKMICHLYVSELDKNGKFGKAKKLPKNINKGNYSSTQPVVAKHKLDKGGEQEVLYFVTDRSGGKGGLDIWYTVILPKSKFKWYTVISPKIKYKNPINLGKEINSIRDEITPYYDSLSGNLYFSSNFHFGFGGYDIFRSKGQLITWTKPNNALLPYNSNVDDTYYIFNKNQNRGFLVSNRIGGINLKSETCCDDIYGYIQPKPLLLVAHTYDKETKGLLKNATEIIIDKSNEKTNDTLKSYNNIEGQYLYNKLIAKEIYSANKNNGYNVISIDSNKVIENSFFNINENGEVINAKVTNDEDSISATRIIDSRYDIISINVFIHKDSKKTPIVIEQKSFDEKEKYFISNTLKDSTEIKNNKISSIASQEIKEEKNILVNNQSNEKLVIKSIDSSVVENKINKLKNIKATSKDTSTIISHLIKDIKKINKHKNIKKQSVEHIDASNSDSIVEVFKKEIALAPVPDIIMIVYFEYNDPEFISHHSKLLDSIADFLKQNSHVNLSVESHTDNIGNKEFNMELSKKRAQSIVTYIDSKGISKKRVKAKWFGEMDPSLPNQNEDGTDNEQNRYKNRRAELKFYHYKKKTN
jgi:outer membrane protein OmpA-like peptidoglycan-associated protein